MRRRALALLLAFALTPFALELGEWATHYVVHGDFAHASGHPETSDEHGCTALLHVCGCHTSVCTQTAERRAEHPRKALAAGLPSRVGRPGRIQDPPPHRPPLA